MFVICFKFKSIYFYFLEIYIIKNFGKPLFCKVKGNKYRQRCVQLTLCPAFASVYRSSSGSLQFTGIQVVRCSLQEFKWFPEDLNTELSLFDIKQFYRIPSQIGHYSLCMEGHLKLKHLLIVLTFSLTLGLNQ